MKKTILILLAFALVVASADAKKKEKKSKIEPVIEKVFLNNVDSMSYSLGLNVGSDFANNIKGIPGGKYNTELIIKAFSTAMRGDSSLIDIETAKKYLTDYIAAEQKKDIDAKKVDGEKFLADNSKEVGVMVTPTGLQYKVVTPAEGARPTAADTVVVHYEGFLLDGKKFDSSVDRGEPIEFPLGQVIKGWTEGLQLMTVGSKYKFYIPYNLAYGEQGSGGVIPPFSTLIFDVELLGIKAFKEVVEPAKVEVKPVVKAKTTKPVVKAKTNKKK